MQKDIYFEFILFLLRSNFNFLRNEVKSYLIKKILIEDKKVFTILEQYSDSKNEKNLQKSLKTYIDSEIADKRLTITNKKEQNNNEKDLDIDETLLPSESVEEEWTVSCANIIGRFQLKHQSFSTINMIIERAKMEIEVENKEQLEPEKKKGNLTDSLMQDEMEEIDEN